MFTNDTTFLAVEGISYAELDGEAVLLDVNSGQYFGLNEVGASILDLVQTPITLGQMKEQILKEFEVDNEQLLDDITAFLEEMTESQLIRVANEAYK